MRGVANKREWERETETERQREFNTTPERELGPPKNAHIARQRLDVQGSGCVYWIFLMASLFHIFGFSWWIYSFDAAAEGQTDVNRLVHWSQTRPWRLIIQLHRREKEQILFCFSFLLFVNSERRLCGYGSIAHNTLPQNISRERSRFFSLLLYIDPADTVG